MSSVTANVAKGIQEYVSPIKSQLVKKSLRRQMLELNGLVSFNKGLYHNQHYENLVKSLVGSRKSYRETKDVYERKSIAKEEMKGWVDYVNVRKNDLSEDFKITEIMKGNFKQIWDIVKDRHTKTIQPSKILDMHAKYVQSFKFDIPIDPRNLMRMLHPHYAYLTYFPAPFTFDNLMSIYDNKLVSSFEHFYGQESLASEIAAYTYWAYFDKELKGYMTVAEFAEFMKVFRLGLNPKVESIKKEFNFALSDRPGEFDRDISERDEIVRFDFMRHIFLERNL